VFRAALMTLHVQWRIGRGFSVEMAMNEPLDAVYDHLPPHIRNVAVKVAQQIALTAEPVKTTLEATFTEFLGQILLHVKEWK
jgi:hypothetical protein